MRRRHYLAAASSLFVAGCSGIRARIDGYERPSGTEPLSGSFSTPSDDIWWAVEIDPGVDMDRSLSTPDDVYVYSEAGLDRFSPDGTHRWHVTTEDTPHDEPSSVTSRGSTLYHELGPRWEQSLLARDVVSGDELWTYDTTAWALTASESAVIVGITFDDGGGRVRAIDADSGEDRWVNSLWADSSAVLAHDLCLVPHFTLVQSELKSTLSALDAATGERLWHYTREDDEDRTEEVEVVGDTAYLLTEFGVTAYDLPGGEERWRRSLDRQQVAMAAAAPGAARTERIVAGSREGTLLGLDAETGETEWALLLPGDVRIGRVGRWEETVAVVGDGLLYGFDIASGEEQWRQDLKSVASAGLRAVVDGTLFVITATEDDERHLETYDVESGRRRWRRALGDGEIDDGVVADRFVVLTDDGDLYGFGAE